MESLDCSAKEFRSPGQMSTGNPTGILQELTDVGLRVIGLKDKVRSGQRDCANLAKAVDTLTGDILRVTVGITAAELGPELSLDLQYLINVIDEIGKFMDILKSRSKLVRFANVGKDTAKLRDLAAALDQAQRRFGTQTDLSLRISALRTRSMVRHDDQTSVSATTLSVSRPTVYTRTKMYHLPPKPQIFVGRDREVAEVIDILLTQPPARLAILGPPGIGKTALASYVLYDELIINYYKERRYFVPCETAKTADDILFMLISVLDVQHSAGAPEVTLITHFEKRDLDVLSSIIVLDHLDQAWDSSDKDRVEELLLRLAGLNNVALMVTLRGTQRPYGPTWSKPYLPPLSPLGHSASRELYLALCGNGLENDEGYEHELSSLLWVLDGLPLAVKLMAKNGQYDPSPQRLLQRWRSEQARMLIDEETSLSSLEVSIRMSLDSSRMKRDADALRLLSALSTLPHGLTIASISSGMPSLTQLEHAAQTLVQAGLAFAEPSFWSKSPRLQVLSPVRAVVVSLHPLKDPYFFELVDYYLRLVFDSNQQNNFSLPREDRQNALAILPRAASNGRLRPAIRAIGIIAFSYNTILGQDDICTLTKVAEQAGCPRAAAMTKAISRWCVWPCFRFPILEGLGQVLDAFPELIAGTVTRAFSRMLNEPEITLTSISSDCSSSQLGNPDSAISLLDSIAPTAISSELEAWSRTRQQRLAFILFNGLRGTGDLSKDFQDLCSQLNSYIGRCDQIAAYIRPILEDIVASICALQAKMDSLLEASVPMKEEFEFYVTLHRFEKTAWEVGHRHRQLSQTSLGKGWRWCLLKWWFTLFELNKAVERMIFLGIFELISSFERSSFMCDSAAE